MRFPWGITIVAAVAAGALTLIAGSLLLNPPRDLIVRASFAPETISPNADGVDDVTVFEYELSEPAFVTTTFAANDGTVFVFREDAFRDPGSHRVLFSGVVDGFTLPDDDVAGTIMRRLMPEGAYTWELQAETESGETMSTSGSLTLESVEGELPQLIEFSVFPQTFTPNQDGIDDRVQINVVANKDHEELDLYLLNENDERVPVIRREELRNEGEAGRHVFDYEGGVDIGADPPADGDYTVIAEIRDAEGQITRQEAPLSIQFGGKPRAEIRAQAVGATVVFDANPYDEAFFTDAETTGQLVDAPGDPEDFNLLPVTMAVGDLLVFKLTVENYGPAPIRTSGPVPGTVYDQTQLAASLGEFEQSGVWRVGLQCETSEVSYPWRWGLGDEDTLTTQYDAATDNTYLYLDPGASAVVWGAIRMTEYNEFVNPMTCWAGLIHEDVAVVNSVVGIREVELAQIDGN